MLFQKSEKKTNNNNNNNNKPGAKDAKGIADIPAMESVTITTIITKAITTTAKLIHRKKRILQ